MHDNSYIITGTATQAASLMSIEQPEILFLGTGTSEGIPRVSCLTNPINTCPVSLQDLFRIFVVFELIV